MWVPFDCMLFQFNRIIEHAADFVCQFNLSTFQRGQNPQSSDSRAIEFWSERCLNFKFKFQMHRIYTSVEVWHLRPARGTYIFPVSLEPATDKNTIISVTRVTE